MIEVKDQQLVCSKCGKSFLFSAKEAKSFVDKGLTNVPKKCPDCRAKERAKKQNRTKYEATCAVCGTVFEIPFQPGDRPLRCIEHFDAEPAPSN